MSRRGSVSDDTAHMCSIQDNTSAGIRQAKWYAPHPPWLWMPDKASSLTCRRRQRTKRRCYVQAVGALAVRFRRHQGKNGDYSIFAGFLVWRPRSLYCTVWLQHWNKEGKTVFGPGTYRPDPSEGITVIADLPQPEIVPYSRNDQRNACPRCGHVAYRDKQSSGRCTTWQSRPVVSA